MNLSMKLGMELGGGIRSPFWATTRHVLTAMNGWRAAARPDLVTNGGFDADSDWDKSGLWTISDGVATMPATGSYLPLVQDLGLVVGTTYTLKFSVLAIQGAVKAISASSDGALGTTIQAVTASGDYEVSFTPESSRPSIAFSRNAPDSSCIIDNVSVRLAGATKLSTSAQRIWDDVLRMLGGKPEKWGTLTAVDPSVVPCAELAPELVGEDAFVATDLASLDDVDIDGDIVATNADWDAVWGKIAKPINVVSGQTYRMSATILSYSGSVRLHSSAGNIAMPVSGVGTVTREFTVSYTGVAYVGVGASNDAACDFSFTDLSVHLASAQPGEHPLDHTAQLTLFNSALNVGVGNVWRSAIGIDDVLGDVVYQSDFSAGVDGWSALNGTTTGNIDSIGSEDDCIRFTVNAAATDHGIIKGYSGKCLVAFDVFIPSTNTDLDGIRIVQNAGSGVVNFENVEPDTWVHFSGTVTAGTQIRLMGMSGSVSAWLGNGTDVFYIKNVDITEYVKAPVLAPSADAASFVGVGSPAWDARLNGTDQYLKADLTGLILAHDPGFSTVFVGDFPSSAGSRVFAIGPDAGNDFDVTQAFNVRKDGTASYIEIKRGVGSSPLAVNAGSPAYWIATSFDSGSLDWASDSTIGTATYDELTNLLVTQLLVGAGVVMDAPTNFGDHNFFGSALLTVPLPNADLTNLAKILKAAHDAGAAL